MIKVKILPNITKFWRVDFEKSSSVYHRFFRRHVCLSNFKTRVIRELPLTAHKTVFSHLKKLKETTRFRLIHFVHNLMIRCSKKEWQKIIQKNAFEQKKEERKKERKTWFQKNNSWSGLNWAVPDHLMAG